MEARLEGRRGGLPGRSVREVASVMIRCPNTGESVSTGIGMDFETFKSVAMEDNVIECPACGETHLWQGKDAFPDA